MSDKLDALQEALDRQKKSDPVTAAAAKFLLLLRKPYYIPGTDPVEYVLPDHHMALAEEILRLREVKSMATALSSAANEYVTEVEMLLRSRMVDPEDPETSRRFECRGMMFGPTHQSTVKARDDLGGVKNPDLKQWLIDIDAADIAAGTINAASLRSTISTWMKDHPIEATKKLSEGNGEVPLAGDELLEKLMIDREEYARRKAQHDRLRGMVSIGENPSLSVTKVP